MKQIKKQEDDRCWWCFRSKQTQAPIQALGYVAIPAKGNAGLGSKGNQAWETKVKDG